MAKMAQIGPKGRSRAPVGSAHLFFRSFENGPIPRKIFWPGYPKRNVKEPGPLVSATLVGYPGNTIDHMKNWFPSE